MNYEQLISQIRKLGLVPGHYVVDPQLGMYAEDEYELEQCEIDQIPQYDSLKGYMSMDVLHLRTKNKGDRMCLLLRPMNEEDVLTFRWSMTPRLDQEILDMNEVDSLDWRTWTEYRHTYAEFLDFLKKKLKDGYTALNQPSQILHLKSTWNMLNIDCRSRSQRKN